MDSKQCVPFMFQCVRFLFPFNMNNRDHKWSGAIVDGNREKNETKYELIPKMILSSWCLSFSGIVFCIFQNISFARFSYIQ